MRIGKKIKDILRWIFPPGRTYLDRKLQDQKNEIHSKFLRQEEKINKILQMQSQLQQSNKKNIENARVYIDQELKRRDEWKKKASEIERSAKGKEVWTIKCPCPEDSSKIRWGDYHYAVSLKKYLERWNKYVVLDFKNDWDSESNADVVLVLRGCSFYRPDRRNKKCKYVMWNISHPDMITEEEYELYDIVCVGSIHYADLLKEKVSVPVFPLLQCTDTELFYPIKGKEAKDDYVFIGNSRGIARSCVLWAIEKKLPLKIWGSGWNTILKEHMEQVVAPFIENANLPELYRTAKVTLNDHWQDMLNKQFVNNRVFDALACGLPVISDGCDELKKIFPDAILYYSSKDEFEICVNYIENHYDEIKGKVSEQWEMIQNKFSFEARAKELIQIIEKFQ